MAIRTGWFFLWVAALAAQTPTIDQSLSFRTATSARISPDGRKVAYVVNRTNWDDNTFETDIWVAEATGGGERFQLTGGKKSSSGPEWSPDGKRILFASDRDGKRQLYVISPGGGEAVQLTAMETGVDDYQWSPDGTRVAFIAADAESKEQKERKEKYGDLETLKTGYTMMHLWTVAVSSEWKERPKPERLTEGGRFSVQEFDWAPDSRRIAFSARRDPDLESAETSDIYVVNLSDRFVKKIVETKGPDDSPLWSPDGKQIAFETADGKDNFYYANSRIAVVSADGGAIRVLTNGFDEEPSLVAWRKTGIYFWGWEKMYGRLYRLNPDTGEHRIAAGAPAFTVLGASVSADGAFAAFSGGQAGGALEIFRTPTDSFAPMKLTAMAEQWKEFRLGSREVITWKSKDGTPIEGVLIKPADFDASRKYPLLVIVHGGPTGIDTPFINPDRYYPMERFLAKGAVILRPNYRGSAGYGERFRSLNVRNLGVGDAWDVISGVDHLIAAGIADKDRVATMGWSQGGYISAFLATSSDRFKAASVGAGISNWTTYYVNTDIHPFTRQYLKATPWDDPEIYRKTSPISYVNQAKTPTLIQHGENDKRVPIPNAYELHQALSDRKVPVKMTVYKGFGHGINKPKQQRHLMEENYAWFSQWIWGEQPPQTQP